MSEEFSSTTDGVTISINETPDVVIVLNEQGPAGGPGPIGPQGPEGPAGPVGPQGEQGPRGETALTFAVGTTTTLEPGSLADVVNSGSDQDIVLDFSIPRGEDGIQGKTGAAGKGVDIGTIIQSLSSKAPEGFAPCQGGEITQQENPELYLAVAGSETEISLAYSIPEDSPGVSSKDIDYISTTLGADNWSLTVTPQLDISSLALSDFSASWSGMLTGNSTMCYWLGIDTTNNSLKTIQAPFNDFPWDGSHPSEWFTDSSNVHNYASAYNTTTGQAMYCQSNTWVAQENFFPLFFVYSSQSNVSYPSIYYGSDLATFTWAINKYIPSVSYEEYDSIQDASNNNCGYFGLDTENGKVKLPTLQKIFLEGDTEDIGAYSQDQIVNITSPLFDFGSGAAGATGGGRGLPSSSSDISSDAKYALRPPDPTIRMQYKNIADSKAVSSGTVYRSLQLNAAWQVNTGDRVKPRSIAVYFYVCVSKYTNMERGPVFTPSVDEDGVLSWTNNGDLVNPPPVSIRGPQGLQGEPGTDGVDGEQGPIGPANTLTIGTVVQGLQAEATITGDAPNQTLNLVLPQGSDGDAATITVGSTTTLTAGSEASVVNSGTSSAAILNFSIPRGDTGNPGQNGADGADGYSPTVTVNSSTDTEYTLNITDVNGVITTPNLKGPKGDKGDKGDQGEAAFSLTVGNVTTGEPGASASVVNVGNPYQQIWDITIPKGDTGEKGEQGPKGDTGAQGPKGDTGEQGPRGVQGIQGNPGPSNVLTIGTVQQGATASASITGSSPNQVLNLTLPKGDKGDKGEPGESEWGLIAGNIDNQTDLQNELNSKLNTNQITNCLLEVPQRVNVELSDDHQLILKAGSVVIVPYGTSAPTMEIGDTLNEGEIVDILWDGAKLFYYVKYDNMYVSQIASTKHRYVYIHNRSTGIMLDTIPLEHTFSGSIGPTNWGTNFALWYDTANNIVKYALDSGSSWDDYCSLPFCIVETENNAGITKIINIFNGFGFIGSTVWCDKGVKWLLPDGRNTDGSLKNAIQETDKLSLATRDYTTTVPQIVGLSYSEKKINITSTYYYEQVTPPQVIGTTLWYNPLQNLIYYKSNSDSDWILMDIIKIGTIMPLSSTTADSRISGFLKNNTFNALDYNNTQFIANQAMPSDTVVSMSVQSSGKLYTAPADGYVLAQAKSTTAGGFIDMTCASTCRTIAVSPSSGSGLAATLPVRKAASFSISYNSISDLNIIFTYTNGAQ